MKDKKNGFTLVEVIVAVAILAVVTIPVVRIFIQTANLDSAARQAQKATDIAQNVLEGIREYSMEEIIDQCMSQENKLSFITDWCEGYTPSRTYSSLANIDDADPTFEDEGGILEYIKNKYGSSYGVWGNAEKEEKTVDSKKEISIDFKGNKIKFAIRGIQYPSGSSTYDVIVSFDVNGDAINHKYILAGNEYFLYTVTVSVYQMVAGTSVKRASLTGAVQNKPDAEIVVSNKSKYDGCKFVIKGNENANHEVHIKGNTECTEIASWNGNSNAYKDIDYSYNQLIEKQLQLCDQCFKKE